VTGGAPAPVRRVVSLVPSVTETLVAWGVPPVACTRFCEQPDLAHVGGTKDPDVGAIVDLAPDLVVMCVEENRREDADALAEAGVTTAALAVDGVADVAPALRMLAGLVGVDPAVVEDVGAAAAPPRLRAFVPIWRRPWMSLNARTYGSSLLEHMGLVNVFADAADRYPMVELDEVARRRPDLVLLPSEPYPFAVRHVDQVAALAAEVRLVDGQDLFWWGTRTPAAIGRLRQEIGS